MEIPWLKFTKDYPWDLVMIIVALENSLVNSLEPADKLQTVFKHL